MKLSGVKIIHLIKKTFQHYQNILNKSILNIRIFLIELSKYCI